MGKASFITIQDQTGKLQLYASEDKLGKEGLKNMHIHFAGIDYSEKGEKKHFNLQESDFNYKELIKALKDFNICGVAISESPNIEEDALLMKSLYWNDIFMTFCDIEKRSQKNNKNVIYNH